MLVQAHELTDIKVAAVLLSGGCPDSLEKKWVHVQKKGHGPEIMKFPVVPIGSELPTFPSCQVSAAALPETPIHAVTLRVTIPFASAAILGATAKANLRTSSVACCVIMTFNKTSSPAMDGAPCRASSGQDMLKL